jgi:predicted TIM-barrel fold metal-dependent hydrolase
MIIDCHCHFGEGDGVTVPADTAKLFPLYLSRAKEAGIDCTVLFSVFHSDYRLANRNVAAVVANNPDRFYGFVFVHARRDRGRIYGMVKEAVERYGFRGIKAHRHDAPINPEICETARRFSVPVLYDVMGKVDVVDLLARDYPDVNFIIPHLGSFADDWRAQGLLINQVARYPNIYTDTAGVRRFDLVAQAIQRAGAKKVLFGTDGPWLHPEVEMEKIFVLKLSRLDEDNVLGGNILRLIAGSQRRLPARTQR